jgi:hypothetical protein
MKKSNLILVSTLAVIMVVILLGMVVVRIKYSAPAVQGDGNIVTQERAVSDFNRIRVSNHYNVAFTQDDMKSVVVTADGNLMDLILTRVENDVLVIESNQRLRSRNEIRLDISNSELVEVTASRAARFITKNQLNLPSLILTGNAGSFMDVNGIIGSVKIVQNAGSRLILKGKGEEMEAEANAGGQIEAFDFETEKAKVVANAGSQIDVNAKELDIRATSGSNIRYIGTPLISNINLNSGASATARN